MDLGLTEKVAIVTGSSRGLGLAAATALAEEGASVVLCARGEDMLKKAAAGIQSKLPGARLATIAADVSTDSGAKTIVDTAVGKFGRIDVLVNNVGTAKGADLESTTDAEWHEAMEQTLFPAVRMSRLAVPHIRRQGGGAIVIVSSIFGREAGGRMTYNAVKAAEISLTKSLAQQLAKDRIRVVSVAPGSILFEGGSWWKRQQADPEGIAQFVKQELPFGRFGTPEEVGAAIAFLASPKASWISGTTVVVDGCQSRMF
jgi:3-oxoacyl-[acyl-carrier protein] reductase